MRYLVVIDYPTSRHPPVAGVYVKADSKKEAVDQVQAMLAEAKYTAMPVTR